MQEGTEVIHNAHPCPPNMHQQATQGASYPHECQIIICQLRY